MLHLVIGPHRQSLRVYHTLLDRNTTYFAPRTRQIGSNEHQYIGTFEADDVLRIELPDENYGQVLAYVHWLQTGRLASVNAPVLSYGYRPNPEGHHEYTVLSRMYAFGSKINDANYEDAATTAILQVFAESSASGDKPTQPAMEHGEWAYRNTGRHSHLTQLFLDIYGYCTQRKLANEETRGWLLETIQMGLPRSVRDAMGGSIQLRDADIESRPLRACDHHCGHGMNQGPAQGWRCPYELEWPVMAQPNDQPGATARPSSSADNRDGSGDEPSSNVPPDALEASDSEVKGRFVHFDGTASRAGPKQVRSLSQTHNWTNAGGGPAPKEAPVVTDGDANAAQIPNRVPPDRLPELQCPPAQAAQETEQDVWRWLRPKEDVWAWVSAHAREPPAMPISTEHLTSEIKPSMTKNFTEYTYYSTPDLYGPVDPTTVHESDQDIYGPKGDRATVSAQPAAADQSPAAKGVLGRRYSTKGKQREGEASRLAPVEEDSHDTDFSDLVVQTTLTPLVSPTSAVQDLGVRVRPELPNPELYRDKGTHRLPPRREINDEDYWRDVLFRTAAAANFNNSRSPSPQQGCMHTAEQLNGADPVVRNGPESETSNEGEQGTVPTLSGERNADAATHTASSANLMTASQPQRGRGHRVYRVSSPPERQMDFIEPHSFWTTSTNAPSHPFPPDPTANQNVQVRKITRAYWGEPWIICPDIRKRVYADDLQQAMKEPDILWPVQGSMRRRSP